MKDKSTSSGVIHVALSSAEYYLSIVQKRKAFVIFALLIISSFLEVFGLASLVPVVIVASEVGGIHKNKGFEYLYQHLHFSSDNAFLLFLIISIFIFFLLKNIFAIWVNYFQNIFTAKLGVLIVESQLNKYLNIPFIYFNDIGTGSFINNTLNVPPAYIGNIVRSLISLFSEIVIVGIILLGILVYKPILLVVLVLVMGPSAWLTYRALRGRAQQVGSRINILRPKMMSTINDLFVGFIELKLAQKQKQFQDKIMSSQEEFQQLDAESYLYTQVPAKLIEMVAILGILTIFLYALFFANRSTELIALISLFGAAAYRLMPSVNRILGALILLKNSQYAITELEAYRDVKYDARMHPNQLPLPFERNIKFSHLSFGFPDAEKQTLQDINITIKKGEKIGFVGSSGSGKTTLMNLLLRFHTEQSGHILIDDVPLDDQRIKAWYDLVGYVKQDTFLMEASIQDNITLGDAIVDEARLRYALEKASLKTFVTSLPAGLDTFIGERGSKLSGGQRQRIGIARALYKQTQVLILDEATSALDNETEREVNEAINALAQTDITILIVAHRITTLRECDKIYELKHGEIVAEHQYQDLIQQVI